MTGLRPALEALVKLNRTEELIEVLAQDTWPSLGFQYVMGATSLWESWGMLPNAYDSMEGGAAMCGPGSLSGGWLVLFAKYFGNGLAGIQQVDRSSGFRQLLLRPMVPWRAQAAKVTQLRAEQQTPLGTVVSAWKRVDDGTLQYNATVPPLVTATIMVPTLHLTGVMITVTGRRSYTADASANPSVVWRHGRFDAGSAPGLVDAKPAYLSSASVAFTASSGEYNFTVTGTPGTWVCGNASTMTCPTRTLVCDAKCTPEDGVARVQCPHGKRIVAIEHASFAAPLAPWVHPRCERGGMAKATAELPLQCNGTSSVLSPCACKYCGAL